MNLLKIHGLVHEYVYEKLLKGPLSSSVFTVCKSVVCQIT